VTGPGGVVGRPERVDNPNLDPGARSRLFWFNTFAFAAVPAGVTRPGDSPRGVVIGPGYQKWDMTLGKRFKLRENVSLQFRAEAFNVFNHTNFLGVSTAFGSTTFGQITSTRDPRLIQFALKL